MAEAGSGRARGMAMRIALQYALFAALWILFSDQAVALLLPEGRARIVANTLKGWAFVIVTAVILFMILRRYVSEIVTHEDALRGSERRLERIVATIPSAVVIVDRAGVVTFANHAAERLLRAPAKALVGRVYDDADWRLETLDGRPMPLSETPAALVTATGEPVYDARYAIVHPDGTRTIVATNASPLLDETGESVAVVTASLDVSDTYAAEQKLVHVNRLYSIVSRTNQAILRIRDEQELYEEACRITVEYGRFRMAWLGVLDRATREVRPVAHAGEERGYLEGVRVTSIDEDGVQGPTDTAARLGRTVVSNDIEHDPYMRPWASRALERGYRACAAVPLRDEAGVVFGVFNVYAGDVGFFDAEETGLLEDLVADISFGVGHIRRGAGHPPA